MISRRQFLRGTGGSYLALPVLPSLLGPAAYAQSAPPMRYAQFLGRFGRAIKFWYPSADPVTEVGVSPAGSKIYATQLSSISGAISPVFGANFDALRNKFSIIRGLDVFDPGVPNSGERLHNTTLPTTGSNRQYAPAGAHLFGYSVDSVLSESNIIYPASPKIRALRMAPGNSINYDWSSWSMATVNGVQQYGDTEWNVNTVYNSLFSSVSLPDPKSNRRQLIMDLVLNDYKKVMNGRTISSLDKTRLDNWMSLISDIVKNLGGTHALSCGNVAKPGTNGSLTNEQRELASMDLIVAALACGATKVASLGCYAGDANTDVHSSIWHDSCHGDQDKLTDNQTKFTIFHMNQFARFLKKLDSVIESDGSTLLDNTFVLYGNEDSTGSHQRVDMPVVVAGAKGKIKTGYYIDYRPRPFLTSPSGKYNQFNYDQHGSIKIYYGRPYNNMLVTAFRAMGLQAADYQRLGKVGFGDYTLGGEPRDDYYQAYLSNANKVKPLEFLYSGT